jgi:hypothetical protein
VDRLPRVSICGRPAAGDAAGAVVSGGGLVSSLAGIASLLRFAAANRFDLRSLRTEDSACSSHFAHGVEIRRPAISQAVSNEPAEDGREKRDSGCSQASGACSTKNHACDPFASPVFCEFYGVWILLIGS